MTGPQLVVTSKPTRLLRDTTFAGMTRFEHIGVVASHGRRRIQSSRTVSNSVVMRAARVREVLLAALVLSRARRYRRGSTNV